MAAMLRLYFQLLLPTFFLSFYLLNFPIRAHLFWPMGDIYVLGVALIECRVPHQKYTLFLDPMPFLPFQLFGQALANILSQLRRDGNDGRLYLPPFRSLIIPSQLELNSRW